MNAKSQPDYGIDDEVLRQASAELRRRRAEQRTPGAELRRPVDRALAWIEAGVYGRCSVCTRPLSQARILADPTDMVCHRCKRAIDASQRAAEDARRRAATVERCPSLVSLSDGPQALHSAFLEAARYTGIERSKSGRRTPADPPHRA